VECAEFSKSDVKNQSSIFETKSGKNEFIEEPLNLKETIKKVKKDKDISSVLVGLESYKIKNSFQNEGDEENRRVRYFKKIFISIDYKTKEEKN
jgi:hypothetical protein